MVCRAVVDLEKGIPPWRELLRMLRRMEARGEVRGGRFVGAFTGEQFALPEAVEVLRKHRNEPAIEVLVRMHASDPLNVTGRILPGARVSGNRAILFRNGVPVAVRDDSGVRLIGDQSPELAWRARQKLLGSASESRQLRTDNASQSPSRLN
ncbi:MAG: hypothetical protein DWQ08_11955 [Proteobacteria bacterium]|nr:MAG: hypothetical protein DWQ08_11955 [Pseudomonadota bacterium]